MVVNWSTTSYNQDDVFTFQFSVGPPPTYDFEHVTPDLPNPTSYRPFKRRRALSDVDGSTRACKKKRRLRLQLITSRLSLPFSAPASNIVNRGISKIANWAKNRADRTKVGNTLRQAAIMNRVRRERLGFGHLAGTKYQKANMEREPIALQSLHMRDKPFVRASLPLPHSPLGLSNYDALDLEDEIEVQDLDDDGKVCFYSDFSSINTATTMEDDEYEYLDDLDGIPHHDHGPILPPDERVMEILKGAESLNDIQFVRLGMG